MKTVYLKYCKAETVFCCTTFLCIVVLVFTSAIARSFNHPIPWSIDISQLLLAWTAFFGADLAFRSNQLVGIDLFTRGLSPRVKEIIEIVILLFVLTALGIFIVFGIKLSFDSYKRSFQTLTLSYSFVTASLPAASVSMAITAVIKLRGHIAEYRQASGKKEALS